MFDFDTVIRFQYQDTLIINEETTRQCAYVVEIDHLGGLSGRVGNDIPVNAVLAQGMAQFVRLVVQTNQQDLHLIFRIVGSHLVQQQIFRLAHIAPGGL